MQYTELSKLSAIEICFLIACWFRLQMFLLFRLWRNREHQLKLLKGEEIPWDWEKLSWLEEGDSLEFSGRVRFEEVSCNAPINCAQPVEWAQRLARRDLKLDGFGTCRVNGSDFCTGKFQPGDGIGAEGRLVILSTPQD